MRTEANYHPPGETEGSGLDEPGGLMPAETPAERAMQILREQGCTQADVSRRLGHRHNSTVNSWFRRSNFPKRGRETFYKLFGANPEWIEYRRGPKYIARPRPRSVERIVGRSGMVVSGETAKMPDSTFTPLIEYPPELTGEYGEYAIVEVHDNDSYPILFRGDLLFVGPFGPPEQAIGRRCVAKLANGNRHLGYLRALAAGVVFFTLFGGEVEGGNQVEEAAPVAWIKPAPYQP